MVLKSNMLPPPLLLINCACLCGLLATLWPHSCKGFTQMYAKDCCFVFLLLLFCKKKKKNKTPVKHNGIFSSSKPHRSNRLTAKSAIWCETYFPCWILFICTAWHRFRKFFPTEGVRCEKFLETTLYFSQVFWLWRIKKRGWVDGEGSNGALCATS